jgi:hypothetical protein
MQNPSRFILILLSVFIFSGCSPFGNSSLIEQISQTVSEVFQNKPAPVKSSPSGGQVVGNGAGYRMNVGLGSASARTKTCNSQMCMDVSISR